MIFSSLGHGLKAERTIGSSGKHGARGLAKVSREEERKSSVDWVVRVTSFHESFPHLGEVGPTVLTLLHSYSVPSVSVPTSSLSVVFLLPHNAEARVNGGPL